jgi:hypothetical protein
VTALVASVVLLAITALLEIMLSPVIFPVAVIIPVTLAPAPLTSRTKLPLILTSTLPSVLVT